MYFRVEEANFTYLVLGKAYEGKREKNSSREWEKASLNFTIVRLY